MRRKYQAGAPKFLAIPGPYDGRHWRAFDRYGVCWGNGALYADTRIRRRFSKNSSLPTDNPTSGRISGTNQDPKKRPVRPLGSSFLGIYDSSGAPSFPLDKWIFKNARGPSPYPWGNFFGNLEFPVRNGKSKSARAESENRKIAICAICLPVETLGPIRDVPKTTFGRNK